MIPLGNLTGLSNQLDGIAALMKNAPSGIMGESAISPPKQIPGVEFGDSFPDFGMPEKQIPSMGFGDQSGFDPYGTPSKQLPQELSSSFAPPAELPAVPGQVGGGAIGSLPGVFGQLDKFNNAFSMASSKYGIDANWLKAIAATERGWEGTSVSGAQGIMQIMPGGYPGLEALYPNWQHDPTQNIMLGAAILNAKRQEQGGSLERGTMGYLGFGTDAYGTTSDMYLASVNKYYSQLQGSGGQSFSGGGSGSIQSMFGANAGVPDWGEFNQFSTNGFYGYGTQYGMNGTNHTGVDVPMAVGTQYRAPMSGVVTCGGTGNGPGADGSGCGMFSDYFGQGAGRVEVKLDNGTVLIFGHSSTSALQPGQRFNAGTVLGTSGGMVSPHIHLEARVVDPSTPSGYRIVDPRTVLGGGSITGGSSSYAAPTDTRGYGSIASQIRNFLQSRR